MMNSVVLIGRLTKNPEVEETEKGNKRTFITIAVPRQYKNVDGKYDTDFIQCVLWNAVAEHTCEYCNKGDLISLKGRIQTSSYEKDGITKYNTEIIAERISFLSSARLKEESLKETE